METGLWELVVENMILPLYPNTCHEIKRCPTTKNILRGPIVVKTDSGPGRLAKEAKSHDFRERKWRLGVYIMIGLPNATSVNQEMDQGYETYCPFGVN